MKNAWKAFLENRSQADQMLLFRISGSPIIETLAGPVNIKFGAPYSGADDSVCIDVEGAGYAHMGNGQTLAEAVENAMLKLHQRLHEAPGSKAALFAALKAAYEQEDGLRVRENALVFGDTEFVFYGEEVQVFVRKDAQLNGQPNGSNWEPCETYYVKSRVEEAVFFLLKEFKIIDIS